MQAANVEARRENVHAGAGVLVEARQASSILRTLSAALFALHPRTHAPRLALASRLAYDQPRQGSWPCADSNDVENTIGT